MAHQQ